MSKKAGKSQSLRNIDHKDWKLKKASDYLEFDIHSFAATLEIYGLHRGTEIGNAALDSLLARARLLIDFFFRNSAKRDDVIAVDYFHDYAIKPYKLRMTKAICSERDKINKQLMHLTTRPMPRLRSNQRYSIKKIAPPIVKAFRKWLSVVPDSRLQKPAKRSRQDFEKHLERVERLIS